MIDSRRECELCKERLFLSREAEDEAMKAVAGSKDQAGELKMTSREDRVAKVTCSGEGINYVIECVICRRKEITRRYLSD